MMVSKTPSDFKKNFKKFVSNISSDIKFGWYIGN